MRNGKISAGARSPTGTSGQPILAEPAGDQLPVGSRVDRHQASTIPRTDCCGAMAQQPCGSGPLSAPQGLVQLVGCRDPKKVAEAQAEQSAARRNAKP